jgi:hypothetical protein
MDEEAIWLGYEVTTAQATWACTKCDSKYVSSKVDVIDYFMTFEARSPLSEGIPPTRNIQLRTSDFRIANEPDFTGFLSLVIEGQLLETEPWDRFVEVYERD